MKLILYSFAFILLFAAPVFGAITSAGSFGSCASGTTNTTCVITTTAILQVGNIAVVSIAADNFGTTDGASSEITSVTDSAANTYEKVCEYRYAEGGAGNGAVVAVWTARATTQLAIGGTVTITFANAISGKGANAGEYTVTSGNKLEIAGTCQTESLNNSIDPALMTVSGLTDGSEYLFLRIVGVEASSAALTATSANWTILTGADGGGVGDLGMQHIGERRILTLSGVTSESSDPAVGAFDDGASIFLALKECTPTVNCAGDAPAVTFRRPAIIVQ